ncbi:hypothetical protein [Clostridium sp.]|uniref:hypothetical protein n=1 Tax=Clostridium sp. TaxID=1506 RepID=UPI003217E4E3
MKKQYSKPEIKGLSVDKTLARPDNKCTNNNGNGLNCIRNPSNEGSYEGDMFKCKYYKKNGHICTSEAIVVS